MVSNACEDVVHESQHFGHLLRRVECCELAFARHFLELVMKLGEIIGNTVRVLM
jgi:hypothetical protein